MGHIHGDLWLLYPNMENQHQQLPNLVMTFTDIAMVFRDGIDRWP